MEGGKREVWLGAQKSEKVTALVLTGYVMTQLPGVVEIAHGEAFLDAYKAVFGVEPILLSVRIDIGSPPRHVVTLQRGDGQVLGI